MKLETDRLIQEGSQAKIYDIKHNPNQCIKVYETDDNKHNQKMAQNEARVSKYMIGNPNIVHIYDYKKEQLIINGVEQEKSYLIMEYCSNGDLYEFMKRYLKVNQFKEQKAMIKNDRVLLKALLKQIINGFKGLHRAGFAHNDIKLENVFISGDGKLKLGDFGLTSLKDKLISTTIGTQSYMAPEMYYAKIQPCNAKSTDIFSLGVLMFILAFGAPPFHRAKDSDEYFRYLKSKPGNTDFFKFHPHTKQLCQEGLIDLNFQKVLISMLQADPSQRLQDLAELENLEIIDCKDIFRYSEVAQLMQQYL